MTLTLDFNINHKWFYSTILFPRGQVNGHPAVAGQKEESILPWAPRWDDVNTPPTASWRSTYLNG